MKILSRCAAGLIDLNYSYIIPFSHMVLWN